MLDRNATATIHGGQKSDSLEGFSCHRLSSKGQMCARWAVGIGKRAAAYGFQVLGSFGRLSCSQNTGSPLSPRSAIKYTLRARNWHLRRSCYLNYRNHANPMTLRFLIYPVPTAHCS